jgi:hypothetical protein
MDMIRAAQEAIDAARQSLQEAIGGGGEEQVARAGLFVEHSQRAVAQAVAVMGDAAQSELDAGGSGDHADLAAGAVDVGAAREGGGPAEDAGAGEPGAGAAGATVGEDTGAAAEPMDVDTLAEAPPSTRAPEGEAAHRPEEANAAAVSTEVGAAVEDETILSDGVRERASAAGLDVEVLATLPREIALEALRAHNIDPLAGASGSRPSGSAAQPAVEFLASLPAGVISEALAAEREIGRGAADVDAGASGRPLTPAAHDFIEALSSFPIDAREDALLGADRALLEQLPQGLRAEAELLHANRGTTAGSVSLSWRSRGAAGTSTALASRPASDPLWQLFVESTGLPEMGLPAQPRALDPGARHLLTEGGVRMLLLHACTYVPSPRLTPAVADACSAHPPAVLEQLFVSPDSVACLTRLSIQLLVDLNVGPPTTGDASSATATDGISRAELATAAAAFPRSTLRLVGLLFYLANRNSHFAECVLTVTACIFVCTGFLVHFVPPGVVYYCKG